MSSTLPPARRASRPPTFGKRKVSQETLSSDLQRAQGIRSLGPVFLEKDIEEQFVRASGPGGQNVNKVSTAVVLKHRPTGIEVRVEKERSQALNRILARRLLLKKLEEIQRQRLLDKQKKRHQQRARRRRRSTSAQQRLLDQKKKHSTKKNLRRKPNLDD